MTTGLLLFAHGQGQIDYVRLAQTCADRCRRWLDLPIAVVTDHAIDASAFDHVIVQAAGSGGQRHWPGTGITQEWFNVGRSGSYDLTPFDRTLLLDSDYRVDSDQLKLLALDDRPFLCHRRHMDLPDTTVKLTAVGKTRTPMAWATVVKFDRHDFSAGVFAAWQMIEKNYTHYAAMFGFKSRPFRNDFALTLALLMMSGHAITPDVEIAWPLINITTGHDLVMGTQVEMTYNTMVDREFKARRLSMSGLDLHVMDKRWL